MCFTSKRKLESQRIIFCLPFMHLDAWCTITAVRKYMLQMYIICASARPTTQENLALVITFIKTFPNIKIAIDKYWPILSINEKLANGFDKNMFIAYRYKNLREILGGNRILKSKIARKNKKKYKQSGKCSLCVLRLNNLSCKQVKQTNIFKSYSTNHVFKIVHDLTRKS